MLLEWEKKGVENYSEFTPFYLKSFAQHAEDVFALGIMLAKKINPKKISYLDLGAGDPISMNNTYLFYDSGAKGVLVEANPYLCERIKKARARDKLICGAVTTGKEKVGKFYINSIPGLSSVNKEQGRQLLAAPL